MNEAQREWSSKQEKEFSDTLESARSQLVSQFEQQKRDAVKHALREAKVTCRADLLTKPVYHASIYVLSSGQTDSQVDASFGLAFNLRFVWLPTCVDLH